MSLGPSELLDHCILFLLIVTHIDFDGPSFVCLGLCFTNAPKIKITYQPQESSLRTRSYKKQIKISSLEETLNYLSHNLHMPTHLFDHNSILAYTFQILKNFRELT